MEKCESRAEGSGGIKEVVKEWLTTSLMTMTDLAQVVNEAPVMPKEKVNNTIIQISSKCYINVKRKLYISFIDFIIIVCTNFLLLASDSFIPSICGCQS